MEFRLYYECLEQAHDYIFPMIKEAAKQAEIKLVKRPRNSEQLPKGSLYAIQSLTTPDILLTGVSGGIEYPLVMIEFTEAVQAEDHELQRTYGAIAAYLSQMFYVKVAGHKQSEKVFGGAEYSPYSTPKMLQQLFDYEGFIIADWETDTDVYNLTRNEDFPSCPPEITILKDTLQSAVKSFLERETKWFGHYLTQPPQKKQEIWFKRSVNLLRNKPSFKIYQTKIKTATGAKRLLKNWKSREDRNRNMNKLRYFVRTNWIGAKINRFNHAMDPDRGVLTFISFIFSDTHKIFGIYALVRKMQILKEEIKDLSTLRKQLRVALEKDEWLKDKGNSLSAILANELIKIADNATSLNQEVNFQYFWEQYQSQIQSNKVILTIAYLLDGIYLNHNGLKLVWDRRALLGNSESRFLDLLKDYFGFNVYSIPCEIIGVDNEVDEDEVTYAIAHRVLIANGFKIVSISYPGAQGGGAVLPEPEKGKEQPREYPDIIAVSPNSNQDVILNESKGMFRQTEIERDTTKILRYKTEKNYQDALKETLVVAKIIDKQDEIRNIIIGVAFGVKSNTQTTWRPDEVDFIFRVVDRKRWSIGIFNQILHDLIPIIEGDTIFPQVFKIKKST